MLVKDQKIEMEWTGPHVQYYIDKGYKYTGLHTKFYCNPEDLKQSSKKKVRVICDCCGKQFEQLYSTYMKHIRKGVPDACHNCQLALWRQKNTPARIDKLYNQIFTICDECGYTPLFDKSDIKTINSIVWYICPKHGERHQSIANMLDGHRCAACNFERQAKNQALSQDYVQAVVNSFNNNILLNKEEYKNAKTKLKIKCGQCGRIYEVDFDKYEHGQTQCISCSLRESKGERKVRKYLEDKNIEYIAQKTFPDCVNVKCLKFDFYLPQYNLLIEYDGEQHFGAVGVYTEEQYELIHKRDSIKNEYCEENNISLLRIPYYDYDNVEIILDNVIN